MQRNPSTRSLAGACHDFISVSLPAYDIPQVVERCDCRAQTKSAPNQHRDDPACLCRASCIVGCVHVWLQNDAHERLLPEHELTYQALSASTEAHLLQRRSVAGARLASSPEGRGDLQQLKHVSWFALMTPRRSRFRHRAPTAVSFNTG
jgi:hypothetical protein